MIKPNFLIVGVARCGTTSIYHYLNQHPQVAMSKKKEPKYFSSINIEFPHNGIGDKSVDSVVIKDRDEYFKLFKNLITTKLLERQVVIIYIFINKLLKVSKPNLEM